MPAEALDNQLGHALAVVTGSEPPVSQLLFGIDKSHF